jgi:MFS-type transporter involved in bile tolerance (Atg22 family)
MRPGVDQGRLVAWCWAVNGFFSVLGSSLTTMLSMSFGFDRTVVIGLVLYVVATLAHLRRPATQPIPATPQP